jgi:hypothetical protein
MGHRDSTDGHAILLVELAAPVDFGAESKGASGRGRGADGDLYAIDATQGPGHAEQACRRPVRGDGDRTDRQTGSERLLLEARRAAPQEEHAPHQSPPCPRLDQDPKVVARQAAAECLSRRDDAVLPSQEFLGAVRAHQV